MKRNPPSTDDADARRAVPPVTVYAADALPKVDLAARREGLEDAHAATTCRVPPREGRALRVDAGQTLRILCPEGAQVGDLNVWNAHDLSERFYSGKTRALHGTHLDVGDRLWSGFPALRPMMTITADTLDWYGFDAFGCGVHDVIGTRCDPYTNALLTGGSYHHCCHSNLLRALVDATELPVAEAEPLVHDVLNVFMCTGFERGSGRYIMKASPVRTGDHIDLFAEMDVLVALSACPGGDCSHAHSSDAQPCHPLDMIVFAPSRTAGWPSPAAVPYDGSHGL